VSIYTAKQRRVALFDVPDSDLGRNTDNHDSFRSIPQHLRSSAGLLRRLFLK
jgi:hypothetical protein